jgi:hypothetical protein
MSFKKMTLCGAALALTFSSGLAQAQGKGSKGVSSSAPGHSTPSTGPGKSESSPGDLKNDKGAKDAKTFAPGQKNEK